MTATGSVGEGGTAASIWSLVALRGGWFSARSSRGDGVGQAIARQVPRDEWVANA